MSTFDDFMIDEAVKKDSELSELRARLAQLEQALQKIAANKHHPTCAISVMNLVDCDCAVIVARAALEQREK